MKVFAFVVLFACTVAIAMAFPDMQRTVAALPSAGLPANGVGDADGGATAAGTEDGAPETAEIRQPRHLLKKLWKTPKRLIVYDSPVYVRRPSPYYVKNLGYW